MKGTRLSVEHAVQLLAEGRVLVAVGKDFGDLVFRSGRPATGGVLLLRPYGSARSPHGVLAAAVEEREDQAGVRARPLPRGGQPRRACGLRKRAAW